MTIRSKQWYTKTRRLPNSCANSSIGLTLREKEPRTMGRKVIKRGPGQRSISGKDFRLAEEIDYIRGRAVAHDGRFVTVGPLALFSTETGDAWLLDPADRLAARLSRDGDPEEVYFEETGSSF